MLNKHFSVIFITLGRDCNFNCKYCLQDNGHFHQRKSIEKPKLSEKLLQFLDSYNYDCTKVMLWGGEPLLYIDSIKELLERYGNKFDWGVITNGILLNKDIIIIQNGAIFVNDFMSFKVEIRMIYNKITIIFAIMVYSPSKS